MASDSPKCWLQQLYAVRIFSIESETMHDPSVTATVPLLPVVRDREGGGRESAENRVSARVFARSNPRRINQPRKTSLFFEPTVPQLFFYSIHFLEITRATALFAKSYYLGTAVIISTHEKLQKSIET